MAVWLRGGHSGGTEVQDFWVTKDGVLPLDLAARLPGERRGTGCVLSATWLGLRLQGLNDLDAARQAARRLRARWDLAFAPGLAGRPMFGPLSQADPRPTAVEAS